MKDRALSWSALAAVAIACVTFAGVVAGRSAGGGSIDAPWAPAWDLRLAFELDGLAGLYAGLAAGVGVLVFVYASAYVPLHLVHQGRPRADERRLHAAMALFLVAMVGLATAQDLVLLFVFWDVTAIASWLLIGFDRHDRHARLSALMALLVTTVSAVLMLIGILMLRAEYGSTQLADLFAAVPENSTFATVAMALIAISALAKSAQVPFHFWLPRAMAAPTPVSAYLHSAAMVAAGVFLLSRVHPLLARSDVLLDGLLVVGLGSMAVGGVLALAADGLKRLLAYSTVAQYGYVTTMLGIGGPEAAGAACFYVLAHALAKSALFMTAGAVTEATGAKAISQTGGLARRLPGLAVGAGAAAAGIAALPLTAGFFKDELFFKAALDHGSLVAGLAVAGAAITFAYMVRFWAGLFLGTPPQSVDPLARRLTWPVFVLGALTIVGGVVVGPFADLARAAGEDMVREPVKLEPAYHLDARAENLMALGAYAGGFVLFGLRARLMPALTAFERLGDVLGPERLYSSSLVALNRLSDRLHDLEVRDLRGRVAAVIVPASALVTAGLFFGPTEEGAYRVGEIRTDDLPLVVALGACVVATLAATRPRTHLPLALALSAVGFTLAVAYSLIGAPDVALVAVLIETIFGLLFVAVFALVPARVLRREAQLRETRSRRMRDVAIAIGSGVVTTAVVWGAYSRPIPEDRMAARHEELTEAAHGKDVVTVILADFRGLDTLGEITVVGVAALAVATLVRGRLRP